MNSNEKISTEHSNSSINTNTIIKKNYSYKSLSLNIITIIISIIGILAGFYLIYYGITSYKGAYLYSNPYYSANTASFGADYYTYSYEAQVEIVSALNGLNNASEKITYNFIILAKCLHTIITAIGILISIISSFNLITIIKGLEITKKRKTHKKPKQTTKNNALPGSSINHKQPQNDGEH